jgi:hypothetical protein
MNQYSQSSSNLEQLLGLLEIVVAPMRYVKLAVFVLRFYLSWGEDTTDMSIYIAREVFFQKTTKKLI